MGGYTPELLKPMARASMRLGLKKALIVHGSGLDEIAPHGDTHVLEINGESLVESVISPKDFGFKEFSLDTVAGGEKEHNYQMAKQILSGKGTSEQKQMIAMNTAPLLLMGGLVTNYKDGAEMAYEKLGADHCIKLVQKIAQG
jgi:anthranilate phosphoribosyltransferase